MKPTFVLLLVIHTILLLQIQVSDASNEYKKKIVEANNHQVNAESQELETTEKRTESKYNKLKGHLLKNIFEYLDIASSSTYTFRKLLKQNPVHLRTKILFQFPPDFVPFEQYIKFLDIVCNKKYKEKYILLSNIFPRSNMPDTMTITYIREQEHNDFRDFFSEISPRDKNTPAIYKREINLKSQPMIYHLGGQCFENQPGRLYMPWFLMCTFSNPTLTPEIKTINDLKLIGWDTAPFGEISVHMTFGSDFQTSRIGITFDGEDLRLEKSYISSDTLKYVDKVYKFWKAKQFHTSSMWKYVPYENGFMSNQYENGMLPDAGEFGSENDLWFTDIQSKEEAMSTIDFIYVNFF